LQKRQGELGRQKGKKDLAGGNLAWGETLEKNLGEVFEKMGGSKVGGGGNRAKQR